MSVNSAGSSLSDVFPAPIPSLTGPVQPPQNISITSSQATAPNVGGNTSDPIDLSPTPDPTPNPTMPTDKSNPSTSVPKEMFIPAPPTTNVTAFWDWIENNFAKCYSPALQSLMTTKFKCHTIAALQTSVTTYNPASLIDLLGDAQYDFWCEQLVDLHRIFNFTDKHFGFDDRIQALFQIPCSTWCRYRVHVYEATNAVFPSLTRSYTPPHRRPDRHLDTLRTSYQPGGKAAAYAGGLD
jgi:hypothetical protein